MRLIAVLYDIVGVTKSKFNIYSIQPRLCFYYITYAEEESDFTYLLKT